MALILPRNPLVYPAGLAPGFNPAHLAVGKTTFSAVAIGTGAINIATGKAGAPTGTNTFGIDARVGPNIVGSSGGVNYILFSSVVPSATDASATMAAIMTSPPSGGSYGGIIAVGSGGSGPGLTLQGGNLLEWNNWGGSNPSPNIQFPAQGTPIFIAASSNSTTCNMVMVNAATGQITTATGSGQAITAHNGDVIWSGSNGLGSNASGGGNAAIMFSNKYLSMPQLLAWTQAPQNFWYPQTVPNIIFTNLIGLRAAITRYYKRLDMRLRR